MNITSAIGRRLELSDYTRLSPKTADQTAGHKEWTHFCVFSPTFELLINFSLSEGTQTGPGTDAETARVTIMAKTSRGWVGEVASFEDDSDYTGGEINLRFGSNQLKFESGQYVVQIKSRTLSCNVNFVPLATPGFADSVKIKGRSSIKWLVVPRMAASGWLEVEGERHQFTELPAYHDHNWGQFGWGDDFSWEWAIALPASIENPWAVVYSRLSDRSRHHTFSEGLLVWRADTHSRTFRANDLNVNFEGLLNSRNLFRLPPVMALICPGVATDIPKRLEVSAEGGGDWLSLSIEPMDAAQILVPGDGDDMSTTILTEAPGIAKASGCIRGEVLDFTGSCLLETVHGEH